MCECKNIPFLITILVMASVLVQCRIEGTLPKGNLMSEMAKGQSVEMANGNKPSNGLDDDEGNESNGGDEGGEGLSKHDGLQGKEDEVNYEKGSSENQKENAEGNNAEEGNLGNPDQEESQKFENESNVDEKIDGNASNTAEKDGVDSENELGIVGKEKYNEDAANVEPKAQSQMNANVVVDLDNGPLKIFASFLRNATSESIEEFRSMLRDPNLTKAELETKRQEWANRQPDEVKVCDNRKLIFL